MSISKLLSKNFLKQLSHPFSFLAIFATASAFIPLGDLTDSVKLSAAFLFPYYIVYKSSRNAEKGVIAAFSAVSSDIFFMSMTGEHFSLLFSLIAGIIAFKVTENMRYSFSLLSLFVSFSLFAVLLGFVYPFFENYLRALCSALKGRGALFGLFNSFWRVAVSDRLGDYFYFKGYSSTALVDGEIVSGAVNLFKVGSADSSVYRYLTGSYFVNIFITVGVFFALYKRVENELKISLIFISLCAVAAGDSRLLALFLLIYNPLIYVSYLFAVFAAYLISALLKLSVGFEKAASLIELIRFGNSWGYLLVTGAVLGLLIYFLINFVASKFRLSGGNFYPAEVARVVSYLGGERNIVRLKNSSAEVRNPNLVNILSLDCDIHGNMVSLNEDDFEMIREYF